MEPLLVIGIIVALAVIAITTPFIKHHATMDAYGLWDEPPVPEGETKAGG